MKKERNIGLGLLVLLAAVLILAVTVDGRTSIVAAQGNRDRPLAPTASGDTYEEQLTDSLISHFAARLGVDETTIDPTFTAAIGDTVAEAVEKGQLTQEQAADIEAQAQGGLRGLLLVEEKEQTAEKRRPTGTVGRAWEAAWKSAGKMLALDGRQMKMALASGTSLTDIANEHNVDAQQLQDRMLTEGKAVLDGAVVDGTLTQDEADAAYRSLTEQVTELMLVRQIPGDADKEHKPDPR